MSRETVAWIVLPALAAASAFFSASETALFSIDDRARNASSASVRKLLAEPQSLLVTLLLSNLIVNVLFFAFANNLAPEDSAYGDLAYGLGAVFVLVLVGEILPKALALRAGGAFAKFAAVPITPLVAILSVPRRMVQFTLEIALRALGDAASPEEGITPDSLYEVLEHSAKGGLIAPSEADLLSEVVELEGIRVREITTPRVDMQFLDVEDSDEERRLFVIARALARRSTWLPVVRGGPDGVVGQVRMRDLLGQPDAPLEKILRPVSFIPEVASVLDLLHFLRTNKVAHTIVVDEYGGTTGFVTIEHVFEEIVGDLRVEGESADQPVLRLSDGQFRVSGGLSIRDWNDLFGREIVPEGFETVGGLVTALLGRIPRTGDKVRLGGLELCVRDVRGRRVTSVDMSIQKNERSLEPQEIPA
jgi:putative hemolysin